MHKGSIALIVALTVLLIAAVWYALEGLLLAGAPMPREGYVAMAVGVVFSFVVGAGLMALLFISSRRGYDEPPRIESDPE
ncbi:hypothetical protein [Tardiphaga sp. P9-11]|uniref:hypothetical protein n=1 Tax=Tardiphaga sp. P9-11 TaxID=2024614 RepID=UPI0011F3DCE0|nr:hypothetical protein [Tardiphaga sp. P9-11]KAA0073965.1 hypothetical protein CIW50_18665 [Tardiphaga sp. P9-11]